ncbi:geranylgeranyl reductase family protein [Frankia sp. AgB1.9]|uniref:geranylgeranyl reductase family protein n=1 Tax=unclassified Frankia TaxID=2632575 RepID=UPI0027DE9F16|nr:MULTISPECIES: geranylgeranyl reductase family protein [unclassified Frankia]MBL7488426.1 geranylgeranyl reductase family protein [Frankia sp. AgW1.1]MBL7550162.1 geranylgeranyl reductase family protein [Frankia sp. AgB1.9]
MTGTTVTSGGATGADADVIVVGAGPAGSAAAYHLANAGLDVLLLEKATFPRDKVCGDGLTPRAVAALVKMGIETGEEAGWARNKGLRIVGGGLRLELPWPELASFPDYGLVRPRADFDELLARAAEKAGARLREDTTVSGPVRDDRTGRVVGVTARSGDDKEPVTYRAPVVVAADGNSARLALSMDIRRRDDRPLGVAVRRYYRSPRTHDDYLESHLELWEGKPNASRLLPGYGWIFGMGDGTSNVGLGILNTTPAFGNTDYRDLLRRWLSALPAEWGYTEDNATGPVRGSALPMGFNRTPHYSDGVLLVGDAAGMVNPFNGEGIAYAMESGELAAEVVAQALARPADAGREKALLQYPEAVRARYGGYYTLGRVFVNLIGNPTVMRLATKYGLPHPVLMRFMLKIMANLTDPRGGDAHDRVINALCRLAPSA